MLHGEVHGALEALDAGVDHLPRQPPERLLDVQVEVRVVQVVVPQPFCIGSPDHTHAAQPPFRSGNKKKRTGSRREHGGIEARSDPGLPYFLRREETACMWMRASGLRRGFTSQLDSADIIDDMVAEVSFVLRGGGMRFPLRLLAFVGEEERLWAWVWTRSRAEAYGRSR